MRILYTDLSFKPFNNPNSYVKRKKQQWAGKICNMMWSSQWEPLFIRTIYLVRGLRTMIWFFMLRKFSRPKATTKKKIWCNYYFTINRIYALIDIFWSKFLTLILKIQNPNFLHLKFYFDICHITLIFSEFPSNCPQ